MTLATEHLLSSAAIDAYFDEASFTRAMLEVEAALALAQADAGLVPADAARSIAQECACGLQFAPGTLLDEGHLAGSLVIPLVKRLTAAVAAAAPGADAYVHFASTSQDVLDTAMVLQTRRALTEVDRALADTLTALSALAGAHVRTPALARTLMQPAGVTSFGLRCGRWAAGLLRARARLRRAARVALRVQLGGASGTLAGLGSSAAAVARSMARRLQLPQADACDAHSLTWHTQRDDWLDLAAQLALAAGAAGKIANDWSLMMQFELGELAEARVTGRGGSSAMPHKRNPVGTLIVLGASRRAEQSLATMMGTQRAAFERGLGDWQLELAEWPRLLSACHAALRSLADTAASLQVNETRMRANIDALRGLIFAEPLAAWLTGHARQLSKAEVQRQVTAWCEQAQREARPLLDVVCAAMHFAPSTVPADLAQCFDLDHAVSPAARLADMQVRALRQQLRLSLPIVPEPAAAGASLPEPS